MYETCSVDYYRDFHATQGTYVKFIIQAHNVSLEERSQLEKAVDGCIKLAREIVKGKE